MSLRDRQKEEGRRIIREAAGELFIANGYTGTTMRAIAERAGVAEATLYNLFRTKAELLLDVFRDRVMGAGETSLHIAHQRIGSLSDPFEMIDLFCETDRLVTTRALPLLRVVLQAAAIDEDVAKHAEAQEAFRYEDQTFLLEALTTHGHLRKDKPYEQLKRGLWLVAAPELALKALDAGWDMETFSEWKAEALQALLLTDARPRDNGG